MKGFVSKVAIVTSAIFSAMFSCTLVFAAHTNISQQTSSKISVITHKNIQEKKSGSNTMARFNSTAGCMGCHQGEATTLADDETADKNHDHQANGAQKQPSPQEE